jgi:uncharacterized protein YjdB
MALASASLPAKLKTIGAYAFAYCSSLSKVTLPTALSAVPASCFEGCEALKSVALPSSVKTIGALAFAGSGQLTTLTMSQSITAIASNAFSQCGKLKALTINATIGAGQKYTLPNYAAVKATAWKGGNTAILKKSSGVTYQGVKAGKVTFYVTDSATRKLTVNVTVKAAPTKIAYKTASATIGVGQYYSTAVNFAPSSAQTTRTYSTANKAIATVDGAGKIKGIKAGSTTIKVQTYNGKTATFKITVKAAPSKIAYKKASVTLKKGATYATAVTLTPSAAQTTRTYASANTRIATVDKTGKLTAIAKGKTTITVKTYNGRTAKFTVTVK